MVPDPYKALKLPHTASADQIKRSYRDMARKLHPDRLSQRPEVDQAEATSQFARISAAYELLSDPRRKAQYDHVYKYGGYDDEEDGPAKASVQYGGFGSSASNHNSAASSSFAHSNNSNTATGNATRKRKSTGIGYSCTDPLAFLWTNGRVQSKMAVAGIQIPSRLQMGNKSGFRFAFSSGHVSSASGGSQTFTTQTTQFCHGKKYTRTETTTIHPDGRRDVVIEGNDFCSRRSFVSAPPSGGGPASPASGGNGTACFEHVAQQPKTEPWYANAWHEVKNKLSMCYNPCTVTVQ